MGKKRTKRWFKNTDRHIIVTTSELIRWLSYLNKKRAYSLSIDLELLSTLDDKEMHVKNVETLNDWLDKTKPKKPIHSPSLKAGVSLGES